MRQVQGIKAFSVLLDLRNCDGTAKKKAPLLDCYDGKTQSWREYKRTSRELANPVAIYISNPQRISHVAAFKLLNY